MWHFQQYYDPLRCTFRELGRIQLIDLLPHLVHVKVLELISMVLPDLSVRPLVKIPRQLSLKATSIQWMFGRTLSNLLSCTIISPLRTEHPDHEKINLPLCEKLSYGGQPHNTLRHILLPTTTQLGVQNRKSTKNTADQQLDWILSGLVDGQFQEVSILFIDLIGLSEPFFVSLAYLS